GSQGGEVKSIKQGYSILQLERERNRFILRAAHPGEPLQDIGEFQDKVGSPEMKIGLFTLSTGTTNTITFRNIRLDQPVSDTYDPDKEGHLGSRLELISISDRHRTVIHTSDQRFEAPNFMPDGKKLLFNQDGSLFTISTAGGVTEKFNTGFANRNNNDHVISFDGKLLGISHHREGMPGFGSTVYYLPIAGGEPILVTPETPSYLHGWSADNKAVVYVAQRNGSSQYHIYRKPIDGGPEVQLTFHKNGHVDGPEYSPDGQWIYYNGSQSGTMQLWRMRPDGTGNEQLTFDERNNWFPHLSPDGKWIAYLSFPPTINPNDHPSYKRVTLNLMPVNGGAPSVIAYLYGGQGTINVPSWSPDSSTIAFVSNSTKKISSK
ncbi:MAG: TolB family protein, partial [Bacteroidota bacterium]